MDVERFYTDDGLPAFVVVTKRGRTGVGTTKQLVYPTATTFDRLWQQGREMHKEIVAG